MRSSKNESKNTDKSGCQDSPILGSAPINEPQHIIPVFSSVYQDFFYGYLGQALVFRSISVYQLVVATAREGISRGEEKLRNG